MPSDNDEWGCENDMQALTLSHWPQLSIQGQHIGGSCIATGLRISINVLVSKN